MVNPLEMWENKEWRNNKNILELSPNNPEKILVKGFETEMDYLTLNSLYIHALLKDYQYKDMVVAVRDYYSEDEMKEVSKMFFVNNESSVTIIPVSLAFLIDYKLATVKTIDNSIVVSTVGNKVVFNVYKTSNENGKFTLTNLQKEIYDDLSDNHLKQIIISNIKKQIYEHAKLDDKTNCEFTIYPLLDTEELIHDKYLDLLEVYEDIKNSVLSNHTSFTIRQVFIEDSKDDKDNVPKKIPLLDVIIDIKKIVKEIEDFLEPLKIKYENIVQNLKNTMVEKEVTINSVYFITEFFEFFKLIFDLEGANKVQNGFIKSGCISFDKKKVELKDVLIASNNLFMVNNFSKLNDEIKIKNEAKNIYEDIINKGGLEVILSDLKAEKYADLKNTLDNLNPENLIINLSDSKKIVNGFTKLSRENYKTQKWNKERVEKIKTIENTLNNTLALENKEPELWSSGLNKQVLKIKEWFDNAQNNEDISGDEFETKFNMLERYVQAYRNKIVRMKQEEQRKKEEEAKKEANKEEENKKGDADKEENKESKEELVEEEVKQARRR
ncbi:hypothetical protein NBO_67g0015 [Nosema bombycis CQ1]|uniref:Uncharacterized protein n=1 Tax=Nosema bombycis (strain CQ1 / CVCC 102059) TaxID=578461 RepID=R0MHC5_NOSB1|nr:hypothetical protein NBO_67g0015 [Nosema bombycis CQ1]|eukprot:EOB13540.1 hypothetical protein NBO_67g0015 [Nosema bombycis CQ1]